MGTYRFCLCFTRRFKIREPEPPPDVKDAFTKYSDGGTHMSAEHLRLFLADMQGEDVAAEEAEQILHLVLQSHHHHHHISKFKRNSLTLEDFHQYLLSVDLNPPIQNKVHHDMTAPLSHYFIYTSHNSYLTGNQLSSDCSDVPIIKGLCRGVRVVELDLWPNSKKNDVYVLHGRTLTTPVELLKCLNSIKQFAFTSSPYPVILTLEDHLTPELQAKVAEMVTQTFGDLLFCPETECLDKFPSPEELKYRIIVSTKPPKEYLEKDKSIKEKDADKDEWGKEPSDLYAFKNEESCKDEWGEEPSDLNTFENEDDKSDSSDTCLKDSDNEEKDTCEQEPRLSKSSSYKRMIGIHGRKRKGNLEEQLRVDPDKIARLSLNEQAFQKAAASHGTHIVRFTQKNFLRIFPKTTRFDSSNYKPQNGWMHGAQMVAFNMQGYGKSLWLMHGMFRSNGGCGYVKKPDFLIKDGPDGQVFDPKAKLPVKKTLKVKVYMGDGWNLDFKRTHFDKYSPPDFYVRVGIAGVPADEMMKKTKIVEDNWVPVWNEELSFPVTVPQLALLRIEVHEYNMSEKDDFGGQTCLPLTELKKGIRAVPLFDRKGERFNSVRLLMRFDFI